MVSRVRKGIGRTQSMLVEKHAAKKKKSSAETWLKSCQKKVKKLAKLGHTASVQASLGCRWQACLTQTTMLFF